MSEALPDIDFEATREFWSGAARGELVIPRCNACDAWIWYPRDACPGCAGTDLTWQPVSGRGTLFSWALVERALFAPFKHKAPYVTGLVALEEDPAVRIVTNLVDCDPGSLEIDMPVHVVFRDLEFDGDPRRIPAPFFTP
jgi:hypothetical protein